MNYIIFTILLSSPQHLVVRGPEFPTMDECFSHRDEIIEVIGRPIINYQVVCVLNDSSFDSKDFL